MHALPGERRPYVDATGEVHWPLVFVYPESMQMDAVEDSREGDTLAAHLDAMFAPDVPQLPWDAAGAYTREPLELFYLSHATKPLGLDQLSEVGLLMGCTAVPRCPYRHGSLGVVAACRPRTPCNSKASKHGAGTLS